MADWTQYEGRVGTDPQTGRKFIVRQGRPVPLAPNDPRAQTGSRAALTPDPRKLAETQATATTEAITRAEDAANQMRGLEAMARDFGRLNVEEGTGPGTEIAQDIRGYIGKKDPQYEQMQSITSRFVPFMPRGPGTLTEFETRLQMLGSPNVNVSGPTNRANIEQFLMMSRLASDRARMMRDYVDKTGSLAGFEEVFADYEKRTRAATEKATPRFGLARESAPPLPRLTPEQARKAPSGTRFIGTDGVERVVR